MMGSEGERTKAAKGSIWQLSIGCICFGQRLLIGSISASFFHRLVPGPLKVRSVSGPGTTVVVVIVVVVVVVCFLFIFCLVGVVIVVVIDVLVVLAVDLI